MAKKILVVDDTPNIRNFLKDLLKREGYVIEEAKDGMDALKLIKTKKFDLVLLDFFMPGISGRDVAEKIRKDPKTKNQKIAFLTVAEFGSEGMKEIKKLNVSGYIKKPFVNKELVIKINEILK